MPTFKARVMKSTFFPSDLPTFALLIHYAYMQAFSSQKSHQATQMTRFLGSSTARSPSHLIPYCNSSSEILSSPGLVCCVYTSILPPSPFHLPLPINPFAPRP